MRLEDCGWQLDQLPTISGALGPSEELGFVFQVSTAHATVGLALAFSGRRRNPEVDTFVITTRSRPLDTVQGLPVTAVEVLLE